MRSRFIILLLLGLLMSPAIISANVDIPKVKTHKQIRLPFFKKRKLQNTHNKWVAAGLDISLGVFGVHRLYLGTEAHVRVMYTLRLGGGGILILVDLGLIIFSKDIETYSDSGHIFMWRNKN